MKPFYIHQRYQSSSEPELGLGMVVQLDHRMVQLFFPGPQETRQYELGDAPLERALLQIGTTIEVEGQPFTVHSKEEQDGRWLYTSESMCLHEKDLPPFIDIGGPRQRLLSGAWDQPHWYDLRYEALLAENHALSSPWIGLQGGRIQLYPHQLDMAKTLSARTEVRAMLADEVGLGKTIEAALVAHRLMLTGRVRRILVIVPEPLTHQWFAEFYLRFNLSFNLVDTDALDSLDDDEQGIRAQTRVICSLEHLNAIAWEQESWDCIIVDEVHHILPHSDEGQTISKLCQNIKHILLLSATPAHESSRDHFDRLAWLSPQVYADYPHYIKQHHDVLSHGQLIEHMTSWESVDASTIRTLQDLFRTDIELKGPSDIEYWKQRLLDLHGPGYHLIKNTRKNIGGFPLRKVEFCSLEGDWRRAKKEFLYEIGRETAFRYYELQRDPRLSFLLDLIERHPQQKFLVLCQQKQKVEAVMAGLDQLSHKKGACFHEGQSLMERDRQAAWFNESDGPQFLVSSNCGAEGRNFQVASHLVLLDCPVGPALLEQRIGRLDRIGQEQDITIYCPFIKGSPQAGLFRWHHEAFQAFEKAWSGLDHVHLKHQESLFNALLKGKESDLQQVIQASATDHLQMLNELAKGRDRLLEHCWHHPQRSEALAKAIAREDQDASLEHYMKNSWELWGIDAIPIKKRCYRLKANDRYGIPFPGFKEQGMSVSFDRHQALKREDFVFLSWDHPMVRDSIGMIIGEKKGQASVVWVKSPKPNLLLECTFRLHHACATKLMADQYFPPTPLKIVMDREGKAIKLNAAKMKALWKPCHKLPFGTDDLRLWIDQMIPKGEALAQAQVQKIIAEAHRQKEIDHQRNQQRLKDLEQSNPSFDKELSRQLNANHAEMEKGFLNPVLNLDSLRVILCGQ